MTRDTDPQSVEVVRFGAGTAAVVLCEHASERLPPPWSWPLEDARLAGTHWAYDPGARELSIELARELRTVAVLAGFSRLLADPNRPEDSAELFRRVAEGRAVALNRVVEGNERERRLALWRAYHDAADREVAASQAQVVLAMHTFTPVYEGTARTVEIGVLFDEELELALGLEAAISALGFRVAQNEPYSGKAGLMYSVDRHAKRHRRRPVELEVRQDLAGLPDMRARLVRAVAAHLASRAVG